MKDDAISRLAVLNLLSTMPPEEVITKSMLIQSVQQMDAAQPEITLESAIDYLHSVGWMQEHDRILTESAQPERMRGKWIDDGDPFMWVCDVCGYRVKRYNNTRYCPHCGAKMEVDDGSD